MQRTLTTDQGRSMYLTLFDDGEDAGLWAGALGPARWLTSAEHDHIVDIARNLFRCPSASIVLEERVEAACIDEGSFANVVARTHGPLVVEDALADRRFRQNVMVRSYPHIRFYVGTAIRLNEGPIVGTLAVMDYVVRDTPRSSELAALDSLASLAADYIGKAMISSERPSQGAHFELLAERSQTSVLTVGMDGRIAAANRASEQLFRVPRAGLVGREADAYLAGWKVLTEDIRAGAAVDGGTLRTILVEVMTSAGGMVPALASLSTWVVDGVPVFRIVIDELA